MHWKPINCHISLQTTWVVNKFRLSLIFHMSKWKAFWLGVPCSNTLWYEQGGGDFTSSRPYHPLCNRPYRSVLIDIYTKWEPGHSYFSGALFWFISLWQNWPTVVSLSLVALRQVSSQVNALKASSSGDKPTGILVNYGPKTHFSLIYPLRVVKQYIK